METNHKITFYIWKEILIENRNNGLIFTKQKTIEFQASTNSTLKKFTLSLTSLNVNVPIVSTYFGKVFRLYCFQWKEIYTPMPKGTTNIFSDTFQSAPTTNSLKAVLVSQCCLYYASTISGIKSKFISQLQFYQQFSPIAKTSPAIP